MDKHKLDMDFYRRNTHTVAKELLGKYIVRGDIVLKITETESYIGETDKACHAYGGRRTKRTEPLFSAGGIFYIYLIYGMYYCLNVITEGKDYPSGVLIRAAEAVGSPDGVSFLRYGKAYDSLSPYQKRNMLNGPAKVCMALNIGTDFNGLRCDGEELYITCGEYVDPSDIKKGKRIGIDYAEEAKDFLWRYFI